MFSFVAGFAGLADFSAYKNLNRSLKNYEAMAASESSVRHLVGFYPYYKFETLKAKCVSVLGTTHSIGGLCFKTFRSTLGAGYNDALKVLLVTWNPPSAGGGPDDIVFFDVDAHTPTPLETDSARVNMTQVDVISGIDQVQQYNNTREFDYVFIDIATFEYLAGRTSNTFYERNVITGAPYHPNPPSGSLGPVLINVNTERGLLLSRGVVTFRTDIGFEKFRTLRMCPAPEPRLIDSPSRPAIAYSLGSFCPPVWRDMGSDVFVAEAAPEARAMMMRSQLQSPPSDDEKCDCVSNNIDMLALHTKLIEKGFIDKEAAPIYRFKFWPWILAALIILILAVIGVVFGTKSLLGEN